VLSIRCVSRLRLFTPCCACICRFSYIFYLFYLDTFRLMQKKLRRLCSVQHWCFWK
jgi:hypothetical protein